MIYLTLDKSDLEGYNKFSITTCTTTVDYGNVRRDDLRAILNDLYSQTVKHLTTLSGEAIEDDIKNFTWKIE